MSNLKGRVAVITGATGGIGFQVAKRLGKDGYTVILKEEAVTENITKIGEKFGRIDVLVNNAGGPGAGIYGTSKAGVHAITRALAKDLAEYGIRVNAVSPGTVDTDFHKQIKSTKPEVFASWKNNILLGRLGQPEEVASVISFLAGEDAAFLTAETIQVGGGQGFGI